MTSAVAGTFADFKLVKTRGVGQFVIEVPGEQVDAALETLGGVPRAGKEVWVGIAVLRGDPSDGAHETPALRPLPRKPEAEEEQGKIIPRFSIRVKEPLFQRWLLGEEFEQGHLQTNEDNAVRVLRDRLHIKSRKDLLNDPAAYAAWQALIASFEDDYQNRRIEETA